VASVSRRRDQIIPTRGKSAAKRRGRSGVFQIASWSKPPNFRKHPNCGHWRLRHQWDARLLRLIEFADSNLVASNVGVDSNATNTCPSPRRKRASTAYFAIRVGNAAKIARPKCGRSRFAWLRCSSATCCHRLPSFVVYKGSFRYAQPRAFIN
jgi:hypothetical protein